MRLHTDPRFRPGSGTPEPHLATLVATIERPACIHTTNKLSVDSINTVASPASKPQSPVQLTERARAEVTKLIKAKNVPEGFGLRVGVRGGGCSGMSYILGFDKLREHDLQFEIGELKLVMDRRHGLYLMGTTVDYHDGLDARGFTFSNPNAASTCGCGSSFGV